ncbi:Uncharacterised protein [Chlamydia trachomatis]|jgi:hypothetical protein|nr:Uncharacterised protein [Chlamydia trachomatis]
MIPLQLLSTQPPATPTLADLLSTLSSGFSVILTAVTSACSTIVSTPFLLFTAVFLFAGGVVGIIGRLLSRS